jgi:hypothetical protein
MRLCWSSPQSRTVRDPLWMTRFVGDSGVGFRLWAKDALDFGRKCCHPLGFQRVPQKSACHTNHLKYIVVYLVATSI